MLNKLINIFERGAGTGRAFWFKTDTIKALVTALASVWLLAYEVLLETHKQIMPTLMSDYSIPLWEANYNIIVKDKDDLKGRRLKILARWLNQGNQSAANLERIFQQAGYDITVEENLDGLAQEENWEAGYRIGNGPTYYYNNGVLTLDDRVTKPTTQFEWNKTFVVSGDFEVSEFPAIKDVILEYKRSSQVCIIVDTTPLYYDFDPNLIDSELTEYDFDSNTVSVENPPLYDFDENLLIF